ncbi:hypothetical protein ACMHYB_55635 [Sorangium sp. So ce1128]
MTLWSCLCRSSVARCPLLAAAPEHRGHAEDLDPQLEHPVAELARILVLVGLDGLDGVPDEPCQWIEPLVEGVKQARDAPAVPVYRIAELVDQVADVLGREREAEGRQVQRVPGHLLCSGLEQLGDGLEGAEQAQVEGPAVQIPLIVRIIAAPSGRAGAAARELRPARRHGVEQLVEAARGRRRPQLAQRVARRRRGRVSLEVS